MYCKKCGAKLDEDAVFCSICGEKQGSSEPLEKEQKKSTRVQVIEGEVHKCPNCGEVIGAFETKCPTCGLEFRDTKASTAVTEFSKQLDELENQRKGKSMTGVVGQAFASAFGVGQTDTIDKQIINLIRNFNVPNTKEDICEFLILACSNINDSVALAQNYSDVGCSSDLEFKALKLINDAWIAKATQVYQKAQFSLGDSMDFKRVEAIYLGKMDSFKKANEKRKRNWIITLVSLIVAFVLLMVFILFMDYLEKQGLI